MKEICKMKSEDLESSLKEIKKMVNKPKYICSKCLRAAKKKSYVCKPLEL
jgi:DNA-binding transcriptional regulator WhiA